MFGLQALPLPMMLPPFRAYGNTPIEITPKYTREHFLSLRQKELFPIPSSICNGGHMWFNTGTNEIPKILSHGAIFDIIPDVSCLSCGNLNDNFNRMFVCNICGVHELFSRFDNLNKIRNHLKTHCGEYIELSNQDINGAFDINIEAENIPRLQSIRNLLHCGDCEHAMRETGNGSVRKCTANCTSCADCVMCGLEYENTRTGTSDLEIQNHINSCKRIIELRTATKTLPEQLESNGLPLDSSLAIRHISPAFKSDEWRKFYAPVQKTVKMYSNPAMKSLVDVTMCGFCLQLDIKCKICKVIVNTKHSNNFMTICSVIYVHLYKNKRIQDQHVTDCNSVTGDIYDCSADTLRGIQKIYNDLKDKKMENLEYLFEDGCFICGCTFEVLSDKSMLDHLNSSHAH